MSLAAATPYNDPFAEHMGMVARALFGEPNPHYSKPGKPRWGSKGSLSINERRGIFHNFETGEKGGVLELIRCEKGFPPREAIEWMISIGCKIDGYDPGHARAKPNGSKRPEQQAAKRKPIETYQYHDEDGALLFEVVRLGFVGPDGKFILTKIGKPEKTFSQRRPDPDNPKVWIVGIGSGEYMRRGPGQDWYRFEEARWARLPDTRERKRIKAGIKQVPYRLPEFIEAIANDQPVLIVEGEQKANLLAEWNIAATCCAEGAGKWTAEHAKHVRGADVIILPDADKAGRDHAETVAQSLQGIAKRIRILELPDLAPKGDVVDWAAAGHTREELDELIEQTPEWQAREQGERPGDGHPRNAKPTRRLVFKRLADIEPRAVNWLWPDRIPRGKFVLFTGAPDAGKTQAALDIGARMTTASSWPDGSGKAPLGSVVILTAEGGLADTIRTRAEAADANMMRIHCLEATFGEDGNRSVFSLQADLAQLGEKIAALGDVALVIIDPITAYLGAGKIDTHKTSDVRAVLSPLGEFADAHSVTVLGITHPPKAGGGKAMNAATGSLAFIAAARSAYLFMIEAETGRTLVLPIKNNLGPRKDGLAFRIVQRLIDREIVASHIVWDSAPVTMTADEAMAIEAGGFEDRSSRAEAAEFLRQRLAAGPVRVKEIEQDAAAVLISKRTLTRARRELGIVTERQGGLASEGSWVCRLPEKHQALE